MQPYYLDDISFLCTQGLPKNSKILKSTKPSIHQPFTRSILATLSVCLEDTKKMPLEAGIPLAAGYLSETVAWAGYFITFRAPAFA